MFAIRTATVVVALLALCTGGATAALTKPNVTFCLLSHFGIQVNTAHAYHVPAYFESTYPNVTFHRRVIGVPRVSPLAPALAKALVKSEADDGPCHIQIGPGWSSLSQSMGLLINALWVESIATSTLITTANAPNFNRVIPSDAESTRGALQLFTAFDWTTGNTVCTDNSYGRSLLDGFAKGNVSVQLARCIRAGAPQSDYDNYLTSLEGSTSRIVFVAMDSSNSMNLALRITERGLHKKFVFVFSEASCSGGKQAFRMIPGAMCATYRRDEAKFSAFLADFGNPATFHNLSRLMTASLSLPYTITNPADYGSSTYSAFAVDAVRFMMNAVHEWYGERGFNGTIPPPAAAELVTYARKQRFTGGITGATVALDESGARDGAEFTVLQTTNRLDGTTQKVSLSDGTSVNAPYYYSREVAAVRFSGAVDRFPPFNWLAGENTSSIVSNTIPPPPSPADKTIVYAGAIVGGVLLIVFIVAMVFIIRHVRRHHRCPTDAKHFVAFYVSVRNEAALRDADVDGALASMLLVEKAARAAARSTNCHHASRLDAHQLFVAAGPKQAIACIAELQASLMTVSWPMPAPKIHLVAGGPGDDLASQGQSLRNRKMNDNASSSYRRRETLTHSPSANTEVTHDSSKKSETSNTPSKPLKARVCIGMWMGSGRISFDADHDRYQYAGTVVDCAAAMCDASVPGEALLPAKVSDIAAPFGSVAVDGSVDLPLGKSGKTASDIAVFIAQGADDLESLASSHSGSTARKKKHADDAAMNKSTNSTESARSARRAAHQGKRGAHAGGGLTAALQSADGGFAARRVGVVAALIPELRRATNGSSEVSMSNADLTKATRVAASAVSHACYQCKAHIVSFDDGVFTCAVNVSEASMTATPATRAAQLAVRINANMAAAPGDENESTTEAAPVLHAHCGVVMGTNTVGALDAARPLPKKIDGNDALIAVMTSGLALQGGVVERARTLALAAESLQHASLTTSPHDDIVHAMVIRSVDIVAWPQRYNAAALIRPVILTSILGEVSNVADGEWLYQLDGIERNPNTTVNAALSALVGGDVAGAVAAMSNKSVAATADSGKTLSPHEGTPSVPAPITSPNGVDVEISDVDENKRPGATVEGIIENVRECIKIAPAGVDTDAQTEGVRLYARRRMNGLVAAFPDV